MVEIDIEWVDSVNSQLSNLNQVTNSQSNRIFTLESSLKIARTDIQTLSNQCTELEERLTLLTNAHNALAAKTTQHISTGERGTDV